MGRLPNVSARGFLGLVLNVPRLFLGMNMKVTVGYKDKLDECWGKHVHRAALGKFFQTCLCETCIISQSLLIVLERKT